MGIKSIMTSVRRHLFSDGYRKQPILKSLLLLYVSFNLIETWQVYLTLTLLSKT